ncbi:MAG: Ig-like domain-containing protein, partial [Lachnospiraceae bacterium]|nr:Ig-like domain-containing protein [Lachnospiraceae bacterium]
EAIEKTIADYNIDTDRIYVGGCSMGGLGTVNMLKAYPTFFAAAFPICPAGELTAEDCAKIAAPAAAGKKTTAIYLIHCIEDNTCNPNATFHTYRNLVEAYKALGVKEEEIPAYTALFSMVDFDGCIEGIQSYLSHWSWVYAENNFDALGDDYDGVNFISSDVDLDWTSEGGDYQYCVKDGNVVLKDISTITYVDGEEFTGQWWELWSIEDSRKTYKTSEADLLAKSLRPSEIGKGYANFFTWLADQSLTDVRDFELNATNFDWGEAITSVVIDLKVPVDAESLDTEDFVYEGDYKYTDYNDGQKVKVGHVVRSVESVEVNGSKVVLNLVTSAMSDEVKYTEVSLDSAKLTLAGEVTLNGGNSLTDCTFAVTGAKNPEIDAFLEKKTDHITYRLYVPKKLNGKNPLLVWLHGAGESGTDNRAQIAGNPVVNFANAENQAVLDNAFVLAPQANNINSWGHDPKYVMEAIQETINNYDIDVNRIYVGGCSMGGLGTVNMLKTYPKFFAAAFPICPAGELTPEDCAKIAAPAAYGKKTTAIYLIHCIEDNTCNPNATFHTYKNLVDAYKALGIDEADIPAYTALFSQVDFDGCPDGFQSFLSHWSWLYVENNFDGLGEDYDGVNFISSDVDRELTKEGGDYEYYVKDGKVAFNDMKILKATYEGRDVTRMLSWISYVIPNYDKSKLVIEEKEDNFLYAKSVRPSEIGKGYANFVAWLADQTREDKKNDDQAQPANPSNGGGSYYYYPVVTVPSGETAEQTPALELGDDETAQGAVAAREEVPFVVKLTAGKSTINLSWGRVEGAVKYVVYGADQGGSYKKLGTTSATFFTEKNVKAGLRKYVVTAFDAKGNRLEKSEKTVGCTTKTKGYTNVSKITLAKKAVSLKEGKTFTIKATLTVEDDAKKALNSKSNKALRYYSTDSSVATVSANGKVKAVSEGTCQIYVVALNGKTAVVNVTVK